MTGLKVLENSYHVLGGDVFGQPHEAFEVWDEDEELVKAEALGHCGAEVLVELVHVLLGGAGGVGGGAWPETCAGYSFAQQEVQGQVGLGGKEEVGVVEDIF